MGAAPALLIHGDRAFSVVKRFLTNGNGLIAAIVLQETNSINGFILLMETLNQGEVKWRAKNHKETKYQKGIRT